MLGKRELQLRWPVQCTKTPTQEFGAPEAGPTTGTSRFGLNARNAAPTQIPTFTKHGHATYQNATFWMLMTVLPATRPNSKPDVMILLRAILEGR